MSEALIPQTLRERTAIATLRERIVAEALSWCGTPFHDAASVKGAGADCVHFIKAVFVNVGLIDDFKIEPYSPQWFEHRDEPKFLQGLERYAHLIETPLPGDVAMYSYGRHAAHSAIVIDERTIVHAWKPAGRVTKGSYFDMHHRLHSLWSVF